MYRILCRRQAHAGPPCLRRIVLLGLLLLIGSLVACGTTASPTSPTAEPVADMADSANAGPTATTEPILPTELAATPTSSALTDLQMPVDVQLTAELALAEHLDILTNEFVWVSDRSLTLTFVTEQEWPDTSLGCPEPDQIYAQAITPGYVLMFTDEQDMLYTVHIDEEKRTVILCDDPGQPLALEQPVTVTRNRGGTMTDDPTPAPLADVPDQIVEVARGALADQLGLLPEVLQLMEAEAREWGDTSLGCPAPDEAYLQVITPGYRLVFADRSGTLYPVHLSETADVLVLCQDGQPIMLTAPAIDADRPATAPEEPEGAEREPITPGPETTPAPADLVTTVQAALANYLVADPANLELIFSDAREWNDSSLGCPAPDGGYGQVITSGYVLVFRDAAAQEYAVHTSSSPFRMILCLADGPVSLETE